MKSNNNTITATERTALLEDPLGDTTPYSNSIEDGSVLSSEDGDGVPKASVGAHWEFLGVLSILLLGVFIANADTSLVLATYGRISSEFDSLENASWLLTGYMLSMCGTQPLYGKLSNIFGRKVLLLLSYVLFAVGNLVCGLSDSMTTLVVGRVIGGACGAGMSSVVSFLIADMVPLRELAQYRSYVNIAQTAGRSCGGPIGGKLAEAMGWRWQVSFLIQVPQTIFAILLVALRLKSPKLAFKGDEEASTLNRLKRIDFLGAFLMCVTIVTFLLPLSVGGNQFEWTHPIIPGFLGASHILAFIFGYVELKVAREPIFPLTLLTRRDIVLPYAILFLQNIAQTFMMFVVPLYFQVTNNASPSAAGFYLIPAVVGNTFGGLITGAYIKKSGRYKMLTIIAAVVAGFCHALITQSLSGRMKKSLQ
ncbi:Fc.00g000510.m01.CDS01 [Cosmosporella sp. VM-42]